MRRLLGWTNAAVLNLQTMLSTMPPRRIILASVLISSLLATACFKQVAKGLGEVQSLHAELTKKFGDEVYVNVNQSGKALILTVSFINSPLNDKTQEERFKRAEEAALFIKTRYARINNVAAIWVGFVRRKTRLLVFHYTEGLTFYPFDKNGAWIRPPEPDAPSSGVKLEVVANYLPASNESNVFAYGIQLEGEPGKDGVTVLPNFKTKGDANVQKGPPPKTVEFDFASYSGKPRFAETVPITFTADEEVVLKTKGTFHGNDAQFCYLPVPYPAFRKMIDAKTLTIKVGAKEYTLTPFQFRALQKMDDYVTE
jgi:hypothetical protein